MTKTIEIAVRISEDRLSELLDLPIEKSEDEKQADVQLADAFTEYEKSHPKPKSHFLDDEYDCTPIDKKKVCPFTVIADSREQAPYHFISIDPWSVIPISTQGLATGDYSMIGNQSRITIERKSVSDFLGSITAGRDRFEREFERMAQMEFAAVVIEDELSNVLSYATNETKVSAKSIVGTVDAWRIRYGVHIVFCMGRRHAERQTFNLLYQFWREEQKRFKSLQTDSILNFDS